MLVATTVIWGSTFFSMKIGQAAIEARVPESGPMAGFLFMGLRFALAAALFPLLVPRSVRGVTAALWRDSLFVSLPGVAGIALQFLALRQGSSAKVAFLTSMMVVTVPLIGWVFLRQRLTVWLWVGGALSLAGVFVMTNPAGGSFGRPELYALAASVLFGLMVHLVNHYTRRHDPERMTWTAFVHFTWTCLLLLLLFPSGRALLSPAVLADLFRPLDAETWLHRWALAWTVPYQALFASIVAFWVLMRFQRDVPPTQAAVIYCLEPIFAAAMAWGLNAEPMAAGQIAGGALILAGNLVCELMRRESNRPAAPDLEPVPREGATPIRTPEWPPPVR